MRLPLGMRAFTFSFRLPMPNSLPPSPTPREERGEDWVNYGRIPTWGSRWKTKVGIYVVDSRIPGINNIYNTTSATSAAIDKCLSEH